MSAVEFIALALGFMAVVSLGCIAQGVTTFMRLQYGEGWWRRD